MRKIIWILLILPVFWTSCQPKEDERAVKEYSDDQDGAVRVPYNEDDTVDSTQAGKFEWETKIYDFGTVEEGTQVEYSYKFKNVGKAPLIVSNAKGSCGCTVPEKPTDPIAPGETGEIKVKFNSTGRTGSNSKDVTLTANTIPTITVLKLIGKVTPKEGEEK